MSNVSVLLHFICSIHNKTTRGTCKQILAPRAELGWLLPSRLQSLGYNLSHLSRFPKCQSFHKTWWATAVPILQWCSNSVHNHLKVQLFLWVTKVNGNIPCRLHLTGACRLMQYCMNCYFQLSKHALQTLHSLFVCFQTAPVKAPRLFKLNFIFSKTFE